MQRFFSVAYLVQKVLRINLILIELILKTFKLVKNDIQLLMQRSVFKTKSSSFPVSVLTLASVPLD